MMCYSLFRNGPSFVSVKAGDTLFVEGEPSDQMYVLIVGEARITTGGRELEHLYPGAPVGEMALIDSIPRAATVEAITDCEFVCVDDLRFEYLVSEEPRLALEVLAVMTRRFKDMAGWPTGRPLAPGVNIKFPVGPDVPATAAEKPLHPH